TMGQARIVEWRGLDGQRLRGTLLLPADYEDRKKYPLLVWVYPNYPAAYAVNIFGLNPHSRTENMQLFATRGYAVLFPEAPVTRGSGTVMRDLAKTIIPGVNKVVDIGIADPNRIGVMGGSWGGYAVLSLLVQTRLFRRSEEHTSELQSPGNVV